MIQIVKFQTMHLPQLQALVNVHLSALVPGWALPAEFIAGRLERNPGEYVVDPWVVERSTLCAIERERVVAAAHLLRYGSGPAVGRMYHHAGEVAWLLGWPNATAAIAAVLEAAHTQFASWGVATIWVLEGGLWVGPFGGLPDAWPHIAAALGAAGYRAHPEAAREERVYGGKLDRIPPPAGPPIAGLELRRTAGNFGTKFAALHQGAEIGYCECVSDMTEGGVLPALRGWAELAEIQIDDSWRSRGIGTWLAKHAAAWLQLGGCSQIVLSVAAEDELAGAGRFYERLGWHPMVQLQHGWALRPDQEHKHG